MVWFFPLHHQNLKSFVAEAYEQAAGRGMCSSIKHKVETCKCPVEGETVLRDSRVHTGLV